VITRKELITEESLVEYMRPVLEDANALATMIKSAEALTDYRLSDHLSKISVPVKILYGDGDQVIRRHHIDEALRSLPAGTILKTHPTAGHHSQEDEPQWVFDEIANFFS
jgi:pimeloyl-ACP methyl ester carboxylesterase